MKNQFNNQILNLFKNFYFLPNSLILTGRLPEELIEEMDFFTDECEKIKNHPLFFLKNHLNIGENKFQVSVPSNIFEDSFMFAFLNHMGEFYLHKSTNQPFENLKRKCIVRKNQGHFDNYDFWINFIYPGNINKWHNHAGSISGVIYMENDINLPTLFKNNISFNGKKGDIIMFPSQLLHSVEENKTDKVRITYAFNLNTI